VSSHECRPSPSHLCRIFAQSHSSAEAPSNQCGQASAVRLRTTLYFGTARPKGTVSELEWQVFLRGHVIVAIRFAIRVSWCRSGHDAKRGPWPVSLNGAVSPLTVRAHARSAIWTAAYPLTEDTLMGGDTARAILGRIG
jgi:hypothetical protein